MLGPLMIGVSGLSLTPSERTQVLHPLVGGVILFARNFASKTQLRALTAEIHALKPDILIAVDQEGGRVQRFRNEFVRLPAAGLCGQYYDQDPQKGLALASVVGELMAMELLASGVDLSFAPVLDIDNGQSRVIGDRGFHRDPNIVALLAEAYIAGMEQAGMAAVGKHFPGHGSVVNDTHVDTAQDSRSLDEIIATDLVPFCAASQAGLKGMMAAHVIYPQIDALPAGFSAIWLQHILRQRLGFKGVIFSDDMGMMAAKYFGTPLEGIEAALNAGCDMVLLCNEPQVVEMALAELKMPPVLARSARIKTLLPKATYQDLDSHARWQELNQRLQTLVH